MTENEAKEVLKILLEALDALPVKIETAICGEALRIAIEKLDKDSVA